MKRTLRKIYQTVLLCTLALMLCCGGAFGQEEKECEDKKRSPKIVKNKDPKKEKKSSQKVVKNKSKNSNKEKYESRNPFNIRVKPPKSPQLEVDIRNTQNIVLSPNFVLKMPARSTSGVRTK